MGQIRQKPLHSRDTVHLIKLYRLVGILSMLPSWLDRDVFRGTDMFNSVEYF